MEMYMVGWVRLNRIETNSWITYKLPYPMEFREGGELDVFLEETLPGWELCSGCSENPDEVDW